MNTLSSHQLMESLARVPRRTPKAIRSLYRSVFVSIYGSWVVAPSLCSACDFRPPLFFQMSLTQKFRDAVAGGAVNKTALRIGTRYPVRQCDRFGTKYGDAVSLTLRERDDDNIVRLLLPRHYGSAMSEADMSSINGRRITYFLTYKGTSGSTNRPKLQMGI